MERRRGNGGFAMVWYGLSAMVMMNLVCWFSFCEGGALRGRPPPSRLHELVCWLEDLVKDAAVGEMGFLRLGPAAKFLVHRDQFQS